MSWRLWVAALVCGGGGNIDAGSRLGVDLPFGVCAGDDVSGTGGDLLWDERSGHDRWDQR